jgi:hypothetical protein
MALCLPVADLLNICLFEDCFHPRSQLLAADRKRAFEKRVGSEYRSVNPGGRRTCGRPTWMYSNVSSSFWTMTMGIRASKRRSAPGGRRFSSARVILTAPAGMICQYRFASASPTTSWQLFFSDLFRVTTPYPNRCETAQVCWGGLVFAIYPRLDHLLISLSA